MGHGGEGEACVTCELVYWNINVNTAPGYNLSKQ